MPQPPFLLRNTESLKLYRDIIRACRLFNFKNEAGERWSTVLQKNARKEFEQARHERDPEIIARLLFVGRDCLNQTVDKFSQKLHTMPSDSEKKPQ
jgi:3-methyladenine DNA glycosylase Tag